MPIKAHEFESSSFKDVEHIYLTDGREVTSVYALYSGEYRLVYSHTPGELVTKVITSLPYTLRSTENQTCSWVIEAESAYDSTAGLKHFKTTDESDATIEVLDSGSDSITSWNLATFSQGLYGTPTCSDVISSEYLINRAPLAPSYQTNQFTYNSTNHSIRTTRFDSTFKYNQTYIIGLWGTSGAVSSSDIPNGTFYPYFELGGAGCDEDVNNNVTIDLIWGSGNTITGTIKVTNSLYGLTAATDDTVVRGNAVWSENPVVINNDIGWFQLRIYNYGNPSSPAAQTYKYLSCFRFALIPAGSPLHWSIPIGASGEPIYHGTIKTALTTIGTPQSNWTTFASSDDRLMIVIPQAFNYSISSFSNPTFMPGLVESNILHNEAETIDDAMNNPTCNGILANPFGNLVFYVTTNKFASLDAFKAAATAAGGLTCVVPSMNTRCITFSSGGDKLELSSNTNYVIRDTNYISRAEITGYFS